MTEIMHWSLSGAWTKGSNVMIRVITRAAYTSDVVLWIVLSPHVLRKFPLDGQSHYDVQRRVITSAW